MKRTALCIFISFMICLYFAGCNQSSKGADTMETDKLSEDALTRADSKAAADLFLNESGPISLGMFSFGIVSENDEKQVYEYNGGELHIPFKVEGLDEKIRSFCRSVGCGRLSYRVHR